MQTGGFQVVQALRRMDVLQPPDRFDLNNYGILDQKVCAVHANDCTFVSDRRRVLLLDRQSGVSQFISQCILINLLQES